MIVLVPVESVDESVEILYNLLKERTPEQSISHKHMPSPEEHFRFVASRPYLAWYLVKSHDEYVGSIYLTHQREIGVFIFTKYARHGYGMRAVKALMREWPGKFLANINPNNTASIEFFDKMGARHIQNTYELDDKDD